jgi:hypothetical protein
MNIDDDYDIHIINNGFERIALELKLRWGSEQLEPYIISILNDTRDHTRAGFPKYICTALNRMLLLHQKFYPEKRYTTGAFEDSTYSDLDEFVTQL